jgi:hypothetical protein
LLEEQENSIHFMKEEIMNFHLSYWMNVINAAMFISIISGYQSFSYDILKGRYHYSTNNCDLSMIIPSSVFLVAAPIAGLSIDKIGKRMAFNLVNFATLMLNRFQ